MSDFESKTFIVAGVEVDAHGKAVSGPEDADDLPEDFPERDLILGTQWTTVSALNAASDEELLAVDGIGPAKLKAIRTALKG